MATDGSKGSIAKVFGYGRIIEHWGLHDPSRENNFISSRIVVSLYS